MRFALATKIRPPMMVGWAFEAKVLGYPNDHLSLSLAHVARRQDPPRGGFKSRVGQIRAPSVPRRAFRIEARRGIGADADCALAWWWIPSPCR